MHPKRTNWNQTGVHLSDQMSRDRRVGGSRNIENLRCQKFFLCRDSQKLQKNVPSIFAKGTPSLICTILKFGGNFYEMQTKTGPQLDNGAETGCSFGKNAWNGFLQILPVSTMVTWGHATLKI